MDRSLLTLSRLLLKCDYEYGVTSLSNPDPSRSGYPANPSSSLQISASLLTAILQPGLSSNPTLQPTSIATEVLDILVTHGENIPSIAAQYFRTIGSWLPIVVPSQIESEIQRSRNESSLEFSTLLLCMHMVTKVPGAANTDAMKTPIYYLAKLLFSVQSSSGKLSMEIAQAGTLLTLYEHGQGMLAEAQTTMGITSIMGVKILTAERKKRTPNIQDMEVGYLWWGIVLLDRYGLTSHILLTNFS